MNEHNNDKTILDLRTLTLAYVQSRQRGHGLALEELIEAHPEYAIELVDFAAHYFVTEEDPDVEDYPAQMEQDDLSIERQILDEAFTKASYPSALTNLVGRAHQRGYDIAALAAELDLGEDVIVSLNERVVDPDSVKRPLLEALGRTLAASIPQVLACLSQPQAIATANYSKRPPKLGQQQTLGDLIRKSQDMAPEQKARWLALLDEPIENKQTKVRHGNIRQKNNR